MTTTNPPDMIVAVLAAVKKYRETHRGLVGPTYKDLQGMTGKSRQTCANYVWTCLESGLLEGSFLAGTLLSRSLRVTSAGEEYLERSATVLEGSLSRD